MSYAYTEVTSLDDWDETAWNRCLTESWSSLQTSMDWDAVIGVFLRQSTGDPDLTVNHTDYTDAQKKNYLWQATYYSFFTLAMLNKKDPMYFIFRTSWMKKIINRY